MYNENEYEYLKNQETDYLLRVIDKMMDYEEVCEAFDLLIEREPDIALAMGVDILKNDKGDEFLQATIWSFLFYGHEEILVRAMAERNAPIGKTLLDDMIADLTIDRSQTIIPTALLHRIINTYNSLSLKIKSDMICDYHEFLKIKVK